MPATIVIDDKWQETYGRTSRTRRSGPTCAAGSPSATTRGQKVLLWWKAWDPEGLDAGALHPPPDGVPVALDPSNPEARELLREVMHELVSPDGLDADGLKVDFTARTPSGRALAPHGPAWGIALLHELLRVVYAR